MSKESLCEGKGCLTSCQGREVVHYLFVTMITDSSSGSLVIHTHGHKWVVICFNMLPFFGGGSLLLPFTTEEDGLVERAAVPSSLADQATSSAAAVAAHQAERKRYLNNVALVQEPPLKKRSIEYVTIPDSQ